jgi:hypothetical protein
MWEKKMLANYTPVSRRLCLTALSPALILSCVLAASPASAGCWSLLKSPKWAEAERFIGKVKLCEVLPIGPNKTAKLSISQFDVCDAPGGIRFHAEAALDCKSGSHDLIKTKAKASVKADIAMDIGTCTVTDARLEFGGAAGQLLKGQPGLQSVVRSLAQSKLSELCGK